MVIGLLEIRLLIPDADSLKHKRTILKSLKDRIRNEFNVSICELDNHEKWQKTTLGIVTLAADNRYANKILSQLIEFIETIKRVEIFDYRIQML